MNNFYFELTDTYCGQLNYSWLTRMVVEAKTLHGALIKVSNATGLNFRNKGLYYVSKSGSTGLYELDCEPDQIWLDSAKSI
jgi:hypothetical protein